MTRIAIGMITVAVLATTLFVAFVLLDKTHVQAEGFSLALTLALVSQAASGISLGFVFKRDRAAAATWVWSLLPILCVVWSALGVLALLVFPLVPLPVLWTLHVFGGLALVICVAIVMMGASHVSHVEAESQAVQVEYKSLEVALASARNALEDGDWDGDLAQRVRTAINKAGATPRGRVTSAQTQFQDLLTSVENLRNSLGGSEGESEPVEKAATEVIRSVEAVLAA